MAHSTEYRRILSRMGYYNYQRGLIYHHLDEQGSWDTHLKKCRGFILKAAEIIKPSLITVFGSGWLLDLPLSELHERTPEIILVDIVHPPEVREQITKLGGVSLVELDVSGGLISEVWKKAGKRTILNRLPSLETVQIPGFDPGFDPGMVVSLNILTQLEALPAEYLRKKTGACEKDLLLFRKTVQQRHLDFLNRHKSVIITDTSEIITEKSGKVKEVKSLLAELPDSDVRDEWTWNFESRNRDYYRARSVFKVIGCLLNGK
ncbi:MAG: hypothetical protein RBT38_01315 [Bacteroidales bacterium]|jgi:hypothetical protein|nr:hypothetical protein [Bacteroidales bacterium]